MWLPLRSVSKVTCAFHFASSPAVVRGISTACDRYERYAACRTTNSRGDLFINSLRTAPVQGTRRSLAHRVISDEHKCVLNSAALAEDGLALGQTDAVGTLLPPRALQVDGNKEASPTALAHEDTDISRTRALDAEALMRTRGSLFSAYLSLSKARLGSLVALTTMAGYYMGPAAFDLYTFGAASFGTALAIASANTFNQVIERNNDAKMMRTRMRVLPRGRLSVQHASAFGAITGLAGCAILASQVNLLAAGLACSNILLYTLAYTPLKQKHWLNTWVGGVVGAIPPLIGWAANTGTIGSGGLVLAGLLFVWQIPHFLSLSWFLKNDYLRGGYQMLARSMPEKVAPIALRYSYYLLPFGYMTYLAGMTTIPFAFHSVILSSWMLWKAHNFNKQQTVANSRGLFMATLLYLPLMLGLMALHKTNDTEKSESKPLSFCQRMLARIQGSVIADNK